MHFSTIATLLLPVAARAAPAPVTETTPTKMVIREAEVFCAIVSSDGPVNCRSGPSTSDPAMYQLPPGTVSWYSCLKGGTVIGGISTWDYNSDYGCYVSGYYTDNNCGHLTLGYCNF